MPRKRKISRHPWGYTGRQDELVVQMPEGDIVVRRLGPRTVEVCIKPDSALLGAGPWRAILLAATVERVVARLEPVPPKENRR